MRILITGAGAPGALGTVASIRRHPMFTKSTLFGCDSSEQPLSSFFEKIFKISDAFSPDYPEELLKICQQNLIDLVIPLTTNENLVLSEVSNNYFPCPIVLLNPRNKIKLLGSKTQTIGLFQKSGCISNNFFVANSATEITEFFESLGNSGIFIKSDSLSGGRGIVKIEKINQHLYTSKPNSYHLAKPSMIAEIYEQLSASGPVLVQEATEGVEFSVDCYASKTSNHIIVPRIREIVRSGISQRTRVTRNHEIIELSKKFIDMFHLEGTFGIQVIVPKGASKPTFLECNPRIQGTMIATVLAGANIIANACLMALDLPADENPDIDWNASFQRTWRGEGYSHGKIITV